MERLLLHVLPWQTESGELGQTFLLVLPFAESEKSEEREIVWQMMKKWMTSSVMVRILYRYLNKIVI